MIFFRNSRVKLIWGLVLLVAVLGCPKKPTETASQSIPQESTGGQPALPPAVENVPSTEQHPVTEEKVKPAEPTKSILITEPLKDIFFDYDRATIKPEMKNALDQDVVWLKNNAQATVQLEGHCDARGTNEYNLALGEKRAHSVKQFLISQGIKASRISTISYGEDRPFCKEDTESCYQQNRRVHFVMK
ncbi:MAG: peptidoglycan-associated lipoprotein Pal [Nitrospirae bacterium]|nr:peptidoglycan-associated lipoprotein Pal [Nitrospirota bacterium]MBI3593782.1 peptidoglycan-associated lipoprotein Pal [Nitrospirota bacterium]